MSRMSEKRSPAQLKMVQERWAHPEAIISSRKGDAGPLTPALFGYWMREGRLIPQEQNAIDFVTETWVTTPPNTDFDTLKQAVLASDGPPPKEYEILEDDSREIDGMRKRAITFRNNAVAGGKKPAIRIVETAPLSLPIQKKISVSFFLDYDVEPEVLPENVVRFRPRSR